MEKGCDNVAQLSTHSNSINVYTLKVFFVQLLSKFIEMEV